MIDLSNLLPGDPISALVPTGQEVGATTNPVGAMTAPGTAPAAPHPDGDAPVVDAVAHEHNEMTLRDGHDTQLDGGKPVLRSGSWNDFGGGPAPRGYRHP